MIDASLHPFESWKKRVVRESRAYYAGRGEPWFLSLWERAKQCANHPLSADFIARNSKQGKTPWCWNPKEYCDKFDAYAAHGGNMAESPPVNVKVETKVKVECPAVKAELAANVEASAVKSEPPIEDPTGQCGPEAETLPAPGLSEVQGTLALPNPNGGKQADIPGPGEETFPDSGLSQVQDALALTSPNGNGNDTDPSAQGAQAAPPANEDVAMAMTQPRPVSDLDVDEQGDAADAAPSAAEGLVSPKEASGDDAAALSPEVPSCAKEAGCDVAAGSTLSKEAIGEGTPSVEVSTSMPCAAVSAPTEASADAMLNEPVVAMTQIEESEETLPPAANVFAQPTISSEDPQDAPKCDGDDAVMAPCAPDVSATANEDEDEDTILYRKVREYRNHPLFQQYWDQMDPDAKAAFKEENLTWGEEPGDPLADVEDFEQFLASYQPPPLDKMAAESEMKVAADLALSAAEKSNFYMPDEIKEDYMNALESRGSACGSHPAKKGQAT